MATEIELLAAVLAGTRRRPIFALITDVYPIISTEKPMSGSIDVSYASSIMLDFETPLMSGVIEIGELTLENILIEYSETEEKMTGVIEIEEITLDEVLIEYSEAEEVMTGVIEVEEITLDEVLVAYSETEEKMTGVIEVSEITLTTI